MAMGALLLAPAHPYKKYRDRYNSLTSRKVEALIFRFYRRILRTLWY